MSGSLSEKISVNHRWSAMLNKFIDNSECRRNGVKKSLVEKDPISVRIWGKLGTHDGQFDGPHGIAVAMNGTIYVSDCNNHRIQSFHSDGTFLYKWGRQGAGDGEFFFPRGISIGIDDGVNESIRRAMLMVPELASFPPGVLPICVSYLGDERIYVTDTYNHRIQVFGMDVLEDGSDNVRFIRKWGSVGSGDGQFNYPMVVQ